MNKVKATFYLTEEVAELLHLVAFQNKIKKSALVEQALREYFLRKSQESKLKRFHELVDKRLDGHLQESEQSELQALEEEFDEADVAIMDSLETERKKIDLQEAQIEQLQEIGKKLDDLLYQFADDRA